MIDVMNCVTREVFRDEFSKMHGDQRDELSKIRENFVRDNATGSGKFVKSRRRIRSQTEAKDVQRRENGRNDECESKHQV